MPGLRTDVPPSTGYVSAVPPKPRKSRSGPSSGVSRALRLALRSPSGLLGFIIIVALITLGILAPLIAPYEPNAADFGNLLQPPSWEHWFGTDDLGRDQLSRVLYGIGASVQIGLASVLLAAVVGVPLGLVAGYYRTADTLVARLVDLLLAFPSLILAVGLAAILGPSAFNATIALSVGAVPGFARIVRGDVLRLKGQDFVMSAVASGASDSRVIFRHILPNSMSALLVQITVTIPAAILGEAALSYLGLGIRPPNASLGIMISNAQMFLQTNWWMAIFPGAAVVALVLAFNLFGDALRDAVDPRGRRR